MLDTTPFAAKRRAVPGLLRGGSTFAKGLWYVAALRARGIVMANGIRPVAAEEKDAGVSAFLYRDAAGTERRLACDAIAFGFGLSSETQLADLAEIPFAFDPVQQQFLPERDVAGRTAIRGVYLAGDGSGIAGADAAELAGERAALALLEDRGHGVEESRVTALEDALRQSRRVSGRARGGLPVSGRHGSRDSGRDHPLPLRGRDRGRVSPGGARARRRRDQPRQGFQPLRHGALSGTGLRTGRRHRTGRGAESAARAHRPAARPTAGQAPPDGASATAERGPETARATERRVVADVAIVGGGTAGCSTALHLRWRGATVVLLERGVCGGQASGVNYGGVRQQGRDLAELPLARRSREMWGSLAEIVGSDCEFVASGHIKLARSAADMAELEAYRESVRPYGLELELLGHNDLRARYPCLGDAAVGGSLCAEDGAANPRLVAPAFRPRRTGGRRRHPRARAGDDDRARRHAISSCARQAASRSAPRRW